MISENVQAAAPDGGRMTAMTDNTPPPQVWPTLRARDALGLIKFLVDAFGFEATAVYADGDRVHHAQLSWPPGGGIRLGSAVPPDADDPWPMPPGSIGCYVVTDEPDGLFTRATAAGAEILTGLHETDYGSRTSPCATRRAIGGRSAPTGVSRGRPLANAPPRWGDARRARQPRRVAGPGPRGMVPTDVFGGTYPAPDTEPQRM